MLEQLRHAIKYGGPDYTYQQLKDQLRIQRIGDERHAVFLVKKEFAFGMSDMDRGKLLRTMQNDVSNNVSTFVRYNSESFTNPEAIKALRGAATEWSAVPGNDISRVATDDVGSFFRSNLVPLITEQNHREAALALSDQPPGYRKALAGTMAERLEPSQLWSGDFSRPNSNRASAGAQTQQGISTLNASASSYPAINALPWTTPNAPQQGYGMEATAVNNAIAPTTTNKRSFSDVNDGPASLSDPSQTFKRSRPDDVHQVPLYSVPYVSQPAASYQPTPHLQPVNNQGVLNHRTHVLQGGAFYDPSQSQPSSSWTISNGTSQPPVPYRPLPQMQPVYNLANSNHQADVYQSGSFHDPSLSRPSSSWSASNGMSPPTAPYPTVSLMQTGNTQVGPSFQANVFQNNPFHRLSQAHPTLRMQPVNNPGPQSYQTIQGGLLQGASTTGPLLAGQPFHGVIGASAPSDPWAEMMRFIDNLPPMMPAAQGPLASSLPIPSALSATPTMGLNGQAMGPTAPTAGVAIAQLPVTTGYPAMTPLQTFLPAHLPSTGLSGSSGPTAPLDPSVDSGLAAPSSTAAFPR